MEMNLQRCMNVNIMAAGVAVLMIGLEVASALTTNHSSRELNAKFRVLDAMLPFPMNVMASCLLYLWTFHMFSIACTFFTFILLGNYYLFSKFADDLKAMHNMLGSISLDLKSVEFRRKIRDMSRSSRLDNTSDK